MAEQKKPAAPAKKAEAEEVKKEEPKKGFPIKTVIVLVAALLIEALTICGAFYFAGGPAKVKAEAAAADEAVTAERPVEELVVSDKFQNTRTGRTYIYDTEIYIVVHKKDQTQVEDQLKEMQATVTTEIATIFRRAEPAHLLEPTLATLTRQVQAMLEERLGKDSDGKSRIQQVLIKKCTQYRSDI